MEMFAKKILIKFTEEDSRVIDNQSKICNWLYNHLKELSEEDYYKNNNSLKLTSSRNLRDQVPKEKTEHEFLKTVHSSPLKNAALRLKLAYDNFFSGRTEKPNFKSWSKKFFSLYYDEPDKGFKVTGKDLDITLGLKEQPKHKKDNRHIKGQLAEEIKLCERDSIRTFRLIKELHNYYAIFTIGRFDKADLINLLACMLIVKGKYHKETYSLIKNYKGVYGPEIIKWLSLDPNHKNLFVGVDYNFNTFELANLELIPYWDNVVDDIKSKRDCCNRRSKEIVLYNKDGSITKRLMPSKKWKRLQKALDKAYLTRREQLKQAFYTIANMLAKEYDVIYIGDYYPTIENSPNKKANRKMINQTNIGMFRIILVEVMAKYNKKCLVTNEVDTTKKCCFCGDMKHKDPSVRKFTCDKCKNTFNRDVNSAVNIASKNLETLVFDKKSIKKLKKIDTFMEWSYIKKLIISKGCKKNENYELKERNLFNSI